ncbi:hypothetical protein [Amycolatopsis alkalitolerans]|uniref:XRE family transcriptional regulator n=1 Tax=Amycolatopsis alkalitolerans TaxID=2547244 RepID=A0A5C4LWR1_9PSEU|nr:hypothetical protein [Amycolatopsis alkalitolerans]TNC23719.1 hypothetical protein FG385_20355 [Amycolatopsis alkalitolerans]
MSDRVTFDNGDWPAVQAAVTRRMAELALSPRDLRDLTSLSASSLAKLRGKQPVGRMHLGTLRQVSRGLGWPDTALADLAQGRLTPEDLANPDPSEPELHERFLRLEAAVRQLHQGLTEIAQLEDERSAKMATLLTEVATLAGLLNSPDLIRVRLAARRGEAPLRRSGTVPSIRPDEFSETDS